MNASPRRRSTWKILGILAAAVVVLLLIAGLWMLSVTETRWTRFQEEMKAAADLERAGDFSRPPLRGNAEPGNAWDDYALAIADMKKLQDRNKLGDLVERTTNADPDWGAKAVEQNGGILESLHRGAARSTSRCPYDWEQDLSNAINNIVEAHQVVNLAVLKARALREAGKPREAVAQLLDAAQLGRDLTDAGPQSVELGGAALLYVFLDEARALAASVQTDAESLADLDQGLAILDGSFPKHARCLRNEHRTILQELAQDVAGGGFPTKLVYLNLFDRLREAQEQVVQACDLPWTESLATGKRVDAELGKSWNPLVRNFAPGQRSAEPTMRDRLARLRLLRTATHFRRTGERLDLADPFGTTLKSAPAGTGLKLWSIGADGVDDGGKGDWRPKAGPDIVLEARR